MDHAAMISFVIPAYNELENLEPLTEELVAVAKGLCRPYEIIFVDDGSTDGSNLLFSSLCKRHPEIKVIAFASNRGQSTALVAGFHAARGEVIITLDADLQNDPNDIPDMLSRLGDYDMVNGWRKHRNDTLSKRVASRIGNCVRNWLTNENIKDTGCSLKIMRADMVKRIKMFRGLHRFLPTLMRLEGARVLELQVNHRQRVRGVSKYTNARRGLEGLQDLLAVRWMIKRHLAPKENLCHLPK